jgi:hypothetical protein
MVEVAVPGPNNVQPRIPAAPVPPSLKVIAAPVVGVKLSCTALCVTVCALRTGIAMQVGWSVCAIENDGRRKRITAGSHLDHTARGRAVGIRMIDFRSDIAARKLVRVANLSRSRRTPCARYRPRRIPEDRHLHQPIARGGPRTRPETCSRSLESVVARHDFVFRDPATVFLHEVEARPTPAVPVSPMPPPNISRLAFAGATVPLSSRLVGLPLVHRTDSSLY